MANVYKLRKGQRIRVLDELGVQYEGEFRTVIPAQPHNSDNKYHRERFVLQQGALVYYFPVQRTDVRVVRSPRSTK